MRPHLQFTLRELLFVVAFAGLGLAALAKGGVLGEIVVSLAVIVTMGLAIVAFVGQTSRQAFAIGFLIPMIVYAAVVFAVGKSELDPYAGKLPTSGVLRPMFEVVVKRTWTNLMTGHVIAAYDPTAALSGNAGAGIGVGHTESPDRQTFMSLGHLLIAMILGYAGTKFAVLVHRPESKDNE